MAEVGIGQAPQVRETALNGFSERVNDCTARLETLRTSLGSLADRIYGEQPETDSNIKEVTPPRRGGIIGQLEEQMDTVTRLLGEVESVANRLYETA